MPITNFAAFLADISDPKEFQPVTIPTLTAVAGRWYDLWTTVPPVGVAPTTAVVPTSATLGALGQQDGGGLALGLVAARFNAMNPGVFLLVDRLSHQGGLSGTVTTAQTTNLPTAALTRYTDGVGVMIGLTIYTLIGAIGSTVSASYTDQNDNTGNITPLVVIGGSNFNAPSRMVMLPLTGDDTGVKAVASVTVTATTGTAGNFGVTLFKPLAAIIVDEVNGVAICDLVTGKWGGGLPEVADGAALQLLGCSASTNLMGSGTVLFSEW